MTFFAILLSLDDKFSLKLNTMIACDNVKFELVGGGGQFGPKLVSKLVFSPFSQVWLISFPLNCIG